eukprot:gnl/Hemi2/3345_TR1167_c0_g3_i1.p1 gnl/Hemi2/3345_TR1167_c0_g3~~gnl/Hemi2/3345_TR1167_c0_g3_i1.p1  ORF type:complete len:467 (-),score=158.81 gnl/Hemi2/3345_TR1167_c0_g3_i1:260-1660(-)
MSSVGSDDDSAGSCDAMSEDERASSPDSDVDMLALQREATLQNMYQVLEPRDIDAMQQAEIQKVASLMCVPHAAASVLLRTFHWNNELLQNKWFEDSEGVCRKAGVSLLAPVVASSEFECPICCNATASGGSMPCSHQFCGACWRDYLTLRITDGGNVLSTTCPMQGCPLTADDAVFRQFVDPPIYERYLRCVTRSFVEDNPKVKWCPGTNCGRAVVTQRAHLKEVQCTCGTKFCFQCGNESHIPAFCDQLRQWLVKCKDDSETANYFAANTQDCPNPGCHVAIEKNGGCIHMTCWKCKHEFCWLCNGDWKTHGGYNCNRPKSGSEEAKSAARQALDRYLHYYTRYNNHHKAIGYAHDTRANGQKKMDELQQQGSTTWMEVQYIMDATEVLLECRRVLKYTYVYAYYMPEGPEKTLFLYQQDYLEDSTERLTESVEAKIDHHDRLQVINQSNLAKTYLQNLIKPFL